MRLLVVTQKVAQRDPILGFFHRWLEEFAKHFDKMTVICLEEGEHHLPQNVKVLSLGKERRKSRINYIINFIHFIWRERHNYDAVFVHMNPEYCILGGIFWKVLKKKVSLWYVHKEANFKLYLAEKFASLIFTSSPESFRLRSQKVHYVGHGIDTNIFKFIRKNFMSPDRILYVGRITKIKNIDVIIKALAGGTLSLVGLPVTTDDEKYKKKLLNLIANSHAKVEWLGAVSHGEMPRIYSEHSISVNAAPDGGMDKAVLESWSSGCPAFVCNKSFKKIFGEYEELFVFEYGNSLDLSKKIEHFLMLEDKESIISLLSKKVSSEYDVSRLVGRISSIIHA